MRKLVLYIIGYTLVFLLVLSAAILSPLQFTGYFAYARIKTIIQAPKYEPDAPITLMSANIRRKERFFSNDKSDIGSHRWWRRAKFLLEDIDSVQPDVLGCQEVTPEQYDFLCKHLSGYGSVLCYRDKKERNSESCPIFYNKTKFELLESGTFWLSETPEKMSKSWGSELYRICTFVRLKSKDGTIFSVFNAHPDSSSFEARVKQIEVIADKIKAVGGQAIVLGDLNSIKGTENGNVALSSLESILKDSRDFDGVTAYGDTYNDYGGAAQCLLDYIYLPADANVISVGKISNVRNGVYSSDHYPIYAEVRL